MHTRIWECSCIYKMKVVTHLEIQQHIWSRILLQIIVISCCFAEWILGNKVCCYILLWYFNKVHLEVVKLLNREFCYFLNSWSHILIRNTYKMHLDLPLPKTFCQISKYLRALIMIFWYMYVYLSIYLDTFISNNW